MTLVLSDGKKRERKGKPEVARRESEIGVVRR
jgi:hypothetical protein